MPFPMKIQPVDSYTESLRNEPGKPVFKSRLKKLFDRQFPSVLRISSVDKPSAGEPQCNKEGATAEFEPSSVCLDKMVQNFIEDSNEKPSAAKCGRHRCNCFNGSSNSSDDEFDVLNTFGDSIPIASSSGDASEMLKSLILCASVAERNLLADIAKIVEKNKICKRKDDLIRIVTKALLASLNHDASVCKSHWEKSPSYPAGEYEFIDVIVDGEKLLIDIDFRSEFAIARPTGNYKSILQSLPYIFVGKPDRLQQIVSIVSEAARQSLRKRGMHVPPWRNAEYMRAKWLSPSTRTTTTTSSSSTPPNDAVNLPDNETKKPPSDDGELKLIFGDQSPMSEEMPVESLPSPPVGPGGDEKAATPVVSTWQPPAVKPKRCERGAMIVTGLASLLKEKP